MHPEYDLQYDPIREQYIASNGSVRVPVRRTIGFAIIKKVEQELGNAEDDQTLKQISITSAQRIFEYIEKFT